MPRFLATTKSDYLSYHCNICGQACETKVAALNRERASCHNCGSSVRMRSIIHLLSIELFGESLILSDFPVKPNIKGIGMSDWNGYAMCLTHKLNYKNTYYHKKPKLDITAIDPTLEGTLDFLISSDVFEHVAPPISVAFKNARRLLKPKGVLIFTVPYTKYKKTKEHFPHLHKYEIIKRGKDHILKNITKDCRKRIFKNLVFHEGIGATLEMRVFSESSLKEEFVKAGFRQVRIYKKSYLKYGIYWNHDWSLPITARR